MSAAPRGLPERLPEGERLLWQGAPDWRVLARRAFHLRKLTTYFALVVAFVAYSSLRHDASLAEVGVATLRAAAVSAVPLALLAVYAWVVARTAVYTITDRRVVLRVGLALPATINVPFAQVGSADLRRHPDGSGSISIGTTGTDRLPLLVLWPHARPWRFARAEPMLRGLRDVQPVAQLLARALAASADMTVPVLQGASPTAARAPHLTMAA